MPKKELTEMSPFERIHNSIGGKTFRAIVLVSLVISLAAVSFGFFLYVSELRRDFRTHTWQMSKTAAELIDTEEALNEAAEVIYHYSMMTEQQREQLQDKHSPLLSEFDGIRGEGFEEICRILRLVQSNNNGIGAFTAFLDPQTNRRVFITDSDQSEGFCPPGSWDYYEPEVIQDLMNGKEYFLDDLYGVGKIPATTINLEPYGYRCMAGTLLAVVDGYPVYVFFDTDMNQVASISRSYMLQYIGLMAFVTAAVLFGVLTHVNKTTVQPINALTKAANDYINATDEEHREKKFFADLDIHTGDEIEGLKETMKNMEAEMTIFVRNLKKITAERERISTELALANRIQTDMLPNIFPAFPERQEFDIYAVMDPAKEVGGDFYDFFLVDDDHLCMEIADVSGKGIPAALFMMATKIIIANNAMQGKTPAEILTATNELICTNNREEMFVTVWLGILEISTGKLTACNAGHEYPVIKDPDTDFKEYKDKHGFIIGGLDKAKYRDYAVDLKPGSKIFVYTDGVVEAADSERNLYGKQRMMKCLVENQEKAPDEILKELRSSVDEFVNKAEQFDDLTVMCMEYKGKQ